jgi:hypothetical protein
MPHEIAHPHKAAVTGCVRCCRHREGADALVAIQEDTAMLSITPMIACWMASSLSLLAIVCCELDKMTGSR